MSAFIQFDFLNLVVDDEPPVLSCLNLTSTTDFGLNSSSNVLVDPSASDNVDRNLTITCSHSSADRFLVGVTEVNCSSTDEAGNTGTCKFLVTVLGEDRYIAQFL